MSGESAFAQNPFRKLGLPATATTAEIRRTYEELAVRLDLGATDQELTKEDLLAIKQALDDPVRRMSCGLFWLHSPRELVDPGIQPHDKEAVSDAIARLKEHAGRPAGKEQAIALHDLAVLAYLAYLEGDDGSQQLDLALASWAEVTEGNQFWAYFADRISEVGDQRLTTEALDRMRRELPSAVLGPLAKSAAAALADGDVAAAADLAQTFRRSGLPEEAVDSAVRAATAPARARVQHGLTTFGEACKKVEAVLGDAAALRSRMDEAETVLVQKVLVPASQLNATDTISDDRALLDQVARAARRLSVMFANHLKEWERSLVLIKEAMDVALSPHLLAELAGDHALVSSEYHLAEADAAADVGQLAHAVAHFELAAEYAQDPREAREWQLQAVVTRDRIVSTSPRELNTAKEEVLAWVDARVSSFRNGTRAAAGLPVQTVDGGSSSARGPVTKPPWRRGGPKAVARAHASGTASSVPKRQPPRWAVVWLVCVGIVAAIVAVAVVAGSDGSGNGPSASDVAARQAADRAAEQALRDQQAQERAERRAARRRARERRRRARARRAREARRRARATSFSCSTLDIDVSQAKRRLDSARKRLESLRGNPSAYNAAVPEVNGLVANYNSLLRKRCDPR